MPFAPMERCMDQESHRRCRCRSGETFICGGITDGHLKLHLELDGHTVGKGHLLLTVCLAHDLGVWVVTINDAGVPHRLGG